MNENKQLTDLQKSILDLAKQVAIQNRDIAAARVSLSVLRAAVALLLSPDDPQEALKQLQAAEKAALDADPAVQASQQDLETLDLIQKWMLSGKSPAAS